MDLREIQLKNQQYLQSLKIPVNQHLPLIEDVTDVVTRSATDVAKRVCALTYLIGLAYGTDKAKLTRQLKDYDLWEFTTPWEKELLAAKSLTQEEINALSWLPESIMALAWSLRLIEMDNLTPCSEALASCLPINQDPEAFVAMATLQPVKQLQQQSDLLYQMHWAAVQARLEGNVCIVNEGIIIERRRAIDWVYGVAKDWEDVPLNT